ncbi:hypothetical protein EJ06DRAFT_531564 [Trichodelitschia bisporula]|uniref:Altered inheritance of mitochondria protein 19 n=1 Tax=Trichodelitschia bisporula TaxID=703511 RepID=A0A6G1HTJ7_9PEZI|nr:hypothetical protein EJ06DRAFT_531564 [Trichodelitschia bisporula]
MSESPAADKTKNSAILKLKAWGENSFPPTILASLITAQHFRPFQALPMLFPPLLLLSSYINVNGYKTDAAGISAAWSGLYMLLAMRRRQGFGSKFTLRGAVRGATLGLAAVNLVGGGLAYMFGQRSKEETSGGES